eukprot:761467-Hanusia_phi.AAC.5
MKVYSDDSAFDGGAASQLKMAGAKAKCQAEDSAANLKPQNADKSETRHSAATPHGGWSN